MYFVHIQQYKVSAPTRNACSRLIIPRPSDNNMERLVEAMCRKHTVYNIDPRKTDILTKELKPQCLEDATLEKMIKKKSSAASATQNPTSIIAYD